MGAVLDGARRAGGVRRGGSPEPDVVRRGRSAALSWWFFVVVLVLAVAGESRAQTSTTLNADIYFTDSQCSVLATGSHNIQWVISATDMVASSASCIADIPAATDWAAPTGGRAEARKVVRGYAGPGGPLSGWPSTAYAVTGDAQEGGMCRLRVNMSAVTAPGTEWSAAFTCDLSNYRTATNEFWSQARRGAVFLGAAPVRDTDPLERPREAVGEELPTGGVCPAGQVVAYRLGSIFSATRCTDGTSTTEAACTETMCSGFSAYCEDGGGVRTGASTQVECEDRDGDRWIDATAGEGTERRCELGRGTWDGGGTWDGTAVAQCVGAARVEFPDVLTNTGGHTPAELEAEAARLRALLATLPGAGRDITSIESVVDVATAVSPQVADLIGNVRRFACLGGLTNFFAARGESMTVAMVPGRGADVARRVVDWFVQPAYGFFGGGFSAAALIPILKNILGADLKILASTIKQLCHNRAMEAAAQGNVVLVGEVLRQVAPPGSGAWNPRDAFSPCFSRSSTTCTGDRVTDEQSLYDAYLSHMSSNPETFRGSVAESAARQLNAQIESTKVLLQSQERIYGATVAKEVGSSRTSPSGAIDDIDGYTETAAACSDNTYTSRLACERAGETWTAAVQVSSDTEIAEFYPYNEGSEEGARVALVEEYLSDFDLDAAMHAGLPEPDTSAANPVVGSCWQAGTEPTGVDAEGIAGAFRKLRYYGEEELRRMDFGRFTCSFIPPDVTAGTDICFGSADDGLFGGGSCSIVAFSSRSQCESEGGTWSAGVTTGDSTISFGGAEAVYNLVDAPQICIYGPSAPSYAATVWGIMSVLVHIGAAWGVWRMWV